MENKEENIMEHNKEKGIPPIIDFSETCADNIGSRFPTTDNIGGIVVMLQAILNKLEEIRYAILDVESTVEVTSNQMIKNLEI